MEYHHNDSNSFCFSTLASAFTVTGENNAESSITILDDKILHSRSIGYRGTRDKRLSSSKYQFNNPGEQNLHYNLNKWKTQGSSEIFITSVKILPW